MAKAAVALQALQSSQQTLALGESTMHGCMGLALFEAIAPASPHHPPQHGVSIPVHLVRREHLDDGYTSLSASRLVPTLQDGDALLSQSLAAPCWASADAQWPGLLTTSAGLAV